jgi:hypothetical protein
LIPGIATIPIDQERLSLFGSVADPNRFQSRIVTVTQQRERYDMRKILGIIGGTLTFGVLMVASAGPASADGFADALSRLEALQERSVSQNMQVQQIEAQHSADQSVTMRVN